MSKGSKQRPTDQQKYATGWDAVFGKKEQVCSWPFCNCKDGAIAHGKCALGFPWKKEEKK